MKSIQNYFFAAIFAMAVGGTAFATIATPVQAADCSGRNTILTLPAWYRGLAVSDGNSCRIISPTEAGGGGQAGISSFVWTIVLNIIDAMLQIIGYVAVGFMIYGGFLFLTSAGSPDGAAKARKTILNAAIGLIIAIASVGIVNLIVSGLSI